VRVEPGCRITAIVLGVPQVAGVEDVLVAEPLAQAGTADIRVAERPSEAALLALIAAA